MDIEGVDLIEVPTENFYLKMLSILPPSFKEFDIIQTGPQYTHLISLFLHKLREEVKHLHTLWGPFSDPCRPTKWLYRLADKVVGVSKFAIDRATETEGSKDCDVIYNGIDIDTFRPREVEEPKRPMVLYVGNLVDFQRPLHVCGLAKRMEDVDFVIKGNGPLLDEVRRRSKKLENVEIISDWIETEELVELYNKATVFFQPSVIEGFGLVTAEAMACETPAVGADATATPEVIRNTGFVFEPDDLEGAEDKIRALLDDSDLRKELGMKARNRVVNNFSFKGMIRDYSRLYKELVEG